MTASPTFQPAWWLPNPHLQTLWSPFFRRGPTLERQRANACGWPMATSSTSTGPARTMPKPRWCWHCTASPGHPRHTTSSVCSAPAGARLGQRGAELARLLGEPNRLPRGYHSGVSDDLAEVVAHLRARRPQAPLYAVGYSLGGNVLLKYLGETAGDCPLLGGVAGRCRLDECADRIGLGFSRVSGALHEGHAGLRDKQRLFGEQGQAEGLAALQRLGPLEGMRTFWDFDGRVTPLHGFADARDYYRRASSRYYLPDIRTPSLIIHSSDDPFVFARSLPDRSELAPCTEPGTARPRRSRRLRRRLSAPAHLPGTTHPRLAPRQHEPASGDGRQNRNRLKEKGGEWN